MVGPGLASDIAAAQPAAGKLRWFFSGRSGKEGATIALARVEECLRWADTYQVWSQFDAVAAAAGGSSPPEQVWADFERRSAEYYGLLGAIVDLKLDAAAAEGFLRRRSWPECTSSSTRRSGGSPCAATSRLAHASPSSSGASSSATRWPGQGDPGDCRDALAETVNGLYKAELVYWEGRWDGADDLELERDVLRRSVALG